MSETTKIWKDRKGWIALVASIAVLATVFVPSFFWTSNTSKASNGIVKQVEDCQTILTQAYNAITETAQVNTQFQQYSKDLFAQALSGGSAQGFTAFLSQQSGTNYAETSVKVQQAIEVWRSKFTNCQVEVNNRKLILANRLTGPFGSFYAWLYGQPHELALGAPGRPKVDMDGDNKITALDYPTVAAEFAKQATSTGEDPGPIDLNPQQPSPTTTR